MCGSEANVDHHRNNPNFEFLNWDIVDEIDLDVSEIWNLACPASPPIYQEDPVHTFKTSVLGVLNLSELALSKGAKLFHTSTSEVYGDPTESPQSESYWGNVNPVGIRSCYDEGKRSAETVLFDMNRTANLQCKIVRIFNTYGPRMAIDDGRVVSNFIVQALQNHDITIYGDGLQTRSFCYVDDLIDGFIRFMELKTNNIGPVNLGNPGEFTILELAEQIITLTNSKSKLVFKDLPSDDPKQRCPDIGLATSKLKWEPKVNLKDGLQETIRYFKTKLCV